MNYRTQIQKTSPMLTQRCARRALRGSCLIHGAQEHPILLRGCFDVVQPPPCGWRSNLAVKKKIDRPVYNVPVFSDSISSLQYLFHMYSYSLMGQYVESSILLI